TEEPGRFTGLGEPLAQAEEVLGALCRRGSAGLYARARAGNQREFGFVAREIVVVSSGSLGGGSRGGGLLGGARRRRSRGANGRGRRRCGRLLDVFVRWLPNAGLVERYRLVPSVGIDAGGGRGGGGLAPRGISWEIGRAHV